MSESHTPEAGAPQSPTPSSLAPLIEALLFVADEPTSVERLATTLMADEEMIGRAIDLLAELCGSRGVRIQRKGSRVQMVSAPEAAGAIERFLGLDLSSRLSTAALETLAIVAYKQPVTRVDVEAIRGVQSDSIIRSLVSKGLIEEVGRLEQVGRPIIYGTTFEFLQYFGLQALSQLPPLEPDENEIPPLPTGKAAPATQPHLNHFAVSDEGTGS